MSQPAAPARAAEAALREAARLAGAGRRAAALDALAGACAAAAGDAAILRRVGYRLLDLGQDEAACLCFIHASGIAPGDAGTSGLLDAFRLAAPPGWMPQAVGAEAVVAAIRAAATKAGPDEAAAGDDGAPVDVVITWVDGADPAFQERLRRRLETHARVTGAGFEPAAHGPQRFRDGGTLRSLLRSVEACLPWAGRVFLVTDDQVPAWLDVRHPRLKMVRHAEIFPDAAMLPCFNSSAIETCLHRIPGLGPRFLYLNDDMVFLRPVARADFIGADGRPALQFGQRWVRRDASGAGLWESLQARMLERLEARLGARPLWRGSSHGPAAYARDSLADIEARWACLIDRTRRNPFRSDRDAAFQLLYLHATEASRRAGGAAPGWRQATSRDARVVQIGQRRWDWRAALARALADRPACVCLNDNCPDTPTAEHEAAAECAPDLAAFLAEAWPEPSSFERR